MPAGAFRGTAAIRSQTVPLPVEIVNDIALLTGSDSFEEEKPKDQTARASVDEKPTPPKREVAKAERVVKSEHPLTKRKRFVGRGVASKGGRTEKYKVKRGDTLMKIAYSKYGNVYRWRDIYEANRDVIKDYNLIYVGSILTIHGVTYLVIERNGEPYLIRTGDTLKSISQKLYGTPDKWRELWNNNQQLVRNPRQIFKGFTLYYDPKSSLGEQMELRSPSSEDNSQ